MIIVLCNSRLIIQTSLIKNRRKIHGDFFNDVSKRLRCGVLPQMGYIGMRGLKGYGFSAALVVTKESILAILVLKAI